MRAGGKQRHHVPQPSRTQNPRYSSLGRQHSVPLVDRHSSLLKNRTEAARTRARHFHIGMGLLCPCSSAAGAICMQSTTGLEKHFLNVGSKLLSASSLLTNKQPDKPFPSPPPPSHAHHAKPPPPPHLAPETRSPTPCSLHIPDTHPPLSQGPPKEQRRSHLTAIRIITHQTPRQDALRGGTRTSSLEMGRLIRWETS